MPRSIGGDVAFFLRDLSWYVDLPAGIIRRRWINRKRPNPLCRVCKKLAFSPLVFRAMRRKHFKKKKDRALIKALLDNGFGPKGYWARVEAAQLKVLEEQIKLHRVDQLNDPPVKEEPQMLVQSSREWRFNPLRVFSVLQFKRQS